MHWGGPAVGQPPPRGRRGKSLNRELAPPTNAPDQMRSNLLCKMSGQVIQWAPDCKDDHTIDEDEDKRFAHDLNPLLRTSQVKTNLKC